MLNRVPTEGIQHYIGIENDTQHQKEHTSQPRVSRRYPAARGTPLADKESLTIHEYRKRYPANKRHTTPPSRVLKIIPNSKRNSPRRQRVSHHPRVSKTIPSTKRYTHPPSRVLKIIPNYRGRNNTIDKVAPLLRNDEYKKKANG